uniref:PWWP domain-containing protein n=1 Tax=Anopheles maculatus TaxID=74869 RepID=A0A182SEL6_9DIPT
MSDTWQLKTPCGVISAIYSSITAAPSNDMEHTKLVKQLCKFLHLDSADLAVRHIKTALADQLIVVTVRAKQRGKPKSSPSYTIPQWETVSEEQPDRCCYECHNTGRVVKCEGCVRSFHERCFKTPEEKQLELSQFVSKEKQIIISASEHHHPTPGRPARRSSTASVTILEDGNSCWPADFQQEDDPGELVADESALASVVKHESGLEFSYRDIKVEEDIKEGLFTDEPMFVCTVRPPNRRLERMLNASTIKPEVPSDGNGIEVEASENDTMMKRYCYACHVLKNSTNNISPNVGARELNYLLSFVFEQYKSWLFRDKTKTVLSSKVIDICKKILLRTPTSLATVQSKIVNEQYNSLEEFHVDLLDIAHNLGIIHGVNSLDYSASMYFLADCLYEIREIRQCSDCYRHSAEKAEPDWFARPCRTRHELVFAKQKSYQYWPAKVVRVMNSTYDVRFFGDKHLRALVNADCVKPIDTDLRSLQVNTKHRGFQQAMAEMLKHQSLSENREFYAFSSTIGQVVSHTQCVQQTVVSTTSPQPLPPSVPCEGTERLSNIGINASRPVTRKRANLNQQSSIAASLQKQRKLLDRLTEPLDLKAKALQLLQESEERFALKLELLDLQHRKEISEVKKKQWLLDYSARKR